MKNKMKMQKILIALLSIVISVIVFGTFLGRTQTTMIYTIRKEGIDLNKSIAEQPEFFTTDKILTSDAEKMPGLVTSMQQLQNKKLIISLKPGSPIFLDALVDEDGGGSFAKTLPEDHTVHKIKDGPLLLPPGTSAGDLIDVAVTVEEKGGNDEPVLTTGMLLRNVKVFSMDAEFVYIQLSQQEDLLLSNAEKYGTIILQLPGLMKTYDCKDVNKMAKKATEAYMKKFLKENLQTTKKEAEKMADDLYKNTKEKYESSCSSEGDKGTVVTKEEVINIIKQNELSKAPVTNEEKKDDETKTDEKTDENKTEETTTEPQN